MCKAHSFSWSIGLFLVEILVEGVKHHQLYEFCKIEVAIAVFVHHRDHLVCLLGINLFLQAAEADQEVFGRDLTVEANVELVENGNHLLLHLICLLELLGYHDQEFLEVDVAVVVGVNCLNNQFDFIVGRVLSQRIHTGFNLFI